MEAMLAALAISEPAPAEAGPEINPEINKDGKAVGSGCRRSDIETEQQDSAPEDGSDSRDTLPVAVNFPAPPAAAPSPLFAMVPDWCATMPAGGALAAIASGSGAPRAAEATVRTQTEHAGAAGAPAAGAAATRETEAAAPKAAAPVAFAIAIAGSGAVAQAAAFAANAATEREVAKAPAVLPDSGVTGTPAQAALEAVASPSEASGQNAAAQPPVHAAPSLEAGALPAAAGAGIADGSAHVRRAPEARPGVPEGAGNESSREPAGAAGGAGPSVRGGGSVPPGDETQAIASLPVASAQLRHQKAASSRVPDNFSVPQTGGKDSARGGAPDRAQIPGGEGAAGERSHGADPAALQAAPNRRSAQEAIRSIASEGASGALSYGGASAGRDPAAGRAPAPYGPPAKLPPPASPDPKPARAAAPPVQQAGSSLPVSASGTRAAAHPESGARQADAARTDETRSAAAGQESRRGTVFETVKDDAAPQPGASQPDPAASTGRPAFHPADQPALRAEPGAPPAPRSVQAPAAEPPAPPERAAAAQRVREVSIVLPPRENGGGPRVELNITSRGSEVRVAVRTPDASIRQTLRTELPALVDRLQQNGYRAEVISSGLERPDAGQHQAVSRSAAGAGGGDSMAWNFNEGRRENPSRDPDGEPFSRPAPKRPESGDRSNFREFFR